MRKFFKYYENKGYIVRFETGWLILTSIFVINIEHLEVFLKIALRRAYWKNARTCFLKKLLQEALST